PRPVQSLAYCGRAATDSCACSRGVGCPSLLQKYCDRSTATEVLRQQNDGRRTAMARAETTLVTGGTSGIGRAICEMLLAQGASVVNLDYATPDWSHPKLVSYRADLTQQEATERAAAQICAEHAITAFV